MMTTTDTPRIYVACLAAYNAGRLHGEWIDADDVDTIREGIARVLKASPIPGAEEYAIHDYDGFGSIRLGEYEDVEMVATLAQGIAEHGEPFQLWAGTLDDVRSADGDTFQEQYRGEWSSEQDYAWDHVTSCGWAGVQFTTYEPSGGYDYTGRSKVNPLDALERYLDMESITSELFQHGPYTSAPAPGGRVYVFED